MLRGFTLLVLCQLLGEICVRLLHLPLPGPVLGMLLLALWLMARRRVDADLASASQALLSRMGLLFVPAGVGLILLEPLLRAHGLAMLAVLLLSTVVTLVVSALALQWLLRRWPRAAEDDNAD